MVQGLQDLTVAVLAAASLWALGQRLESWGLLGLELSRAGLILKKLPAIPFAFAALPGQVAASTIRATDDCNNPGNDVAGSSRAS